MGGLIGMVLAAQPNSPIRRLVLNDAGPFIPKAAPERLLGYVGLAPSFPKVADAEQYLRTVLAPFGALTDEQWAHLARYSVRQSTRGDYSMAYDPGIVAPMRSVPLQDWDLWPVWDQIRCPV